MAAAYRNAVAFYDPSQYNAGSTLEDNILFGRVAYGIADGPRRVREVVRAVLDELDLRKAVFETGLGFNVGSGGKRLTLAPHIVFLFLVLSFRSSVSDSDFVSRR